MKEKGTNTPSFVDPVRSNPLSRAAFQSTIKRSLQNDYKMGYKK